MHTLSRAPRRNRPYNSSQELFSIRHFLLLLSSLSPFSTWHCSWRAGLVGYNFPFGGNHDGCDSDPTCLSESVFQLYYSKAWVPSEGKMSIFPHIADTINTRAHSSHTQAVELKKQMNDGVRTDLFASVWPTLNETVETTSQRLIIAKWNPPTTAGDLGAVFLSRGLGDLLRETVSFSPWMWSVSALLSFSVSNATELQLICSRKNVWRLD